MKKREEKQMVQVQIDHNDTLEKSQVRLNQTHDLHMSSIDASQIDNGAEMVPFPTEVKKEEND